MSWRGLPVSGPTDGHADGAALNACHSHPDHASGRTDRATPRFRGHGEVYRAADTRLDRTVAIKLLPDHIASDAELRERFEREARMISSLSHPHICTLSDVGEQDGALSCD
jgi:hypothetical protein